MMRSKHERSTSTYEPSFEHLVVAQNKISLLSLIIRRKKIILASDVERPSSASF